MSDNSDFLTAKQLAQKVGVSKRTIDSLSKSGKLPYYKPFGGRNSLRLYRYTEIERIITESKVN